MEDQKLLPMIMEPYYYLMTAKRYDHPPRLKDDRRKVRLVRDIIHPYTGELLGGYNKGTIGVVVPLNEHNLQKMFIENLEWINGESLFNRDSQRLDKTYDFFRYGTHYKTGKYELTHWHTYISRFDFEYVDNEKEELPEIKIKSTTKKVIQLSIFDNE